MKNIHNPEDLASLKKRAASLQPDAKALWGQMNVSQAICHMADQFRLALWEIKAKEESTFISRTLVKSIALRVKAPKGKISTTHEIDQVALRGTPPTQHQADIDQLFEVIDRFLTWDPDKPMQPHSKFGKMSHKQWARLGYSHMDHHLSQFGA